MRRSAAACLLFMLLANTLMVSGDGGADGAGFGELGRGSSRATILIHDVFELQNMSKDLNGSYELACDIDASDTVNWNGGAGFAPVGTSTNNFNGSLDGKNHTIRGLFINRSTAENIGLIGYLDSGGLVKDTRLVEDDVAGKSSVGGLVGYSEGAISNSHANGNVAMVMQCDNAGGLVGYSAGTVSNSSAMGHVSGSDYGAVPGARWRYMGGLLGYNTGTVSNSSAAAHVTGPKHGYCLGGLVGYNTGTVIDSHATGDADGDDSIGGLVGYEVYGRVSNSYATGNVSGSYYYIAGLVGNDFRGAVINSYATGNVTGFSFYVAGLVGYNFIGPVTNSYATGNVTGTGICAGGLVGYNDGPVTNSYATGNVAGDFDVGGLVGAQGSSVTCSYATGNVTGNFNVGGLAGYNSRSAGNATVTKSYAAGNVNGTREVGGLVGRNNGLMDNSYARGNVNGGSYVGGLVGNNTGGTVDNSYAAGVVTGGSHLGGLVGGSNGTVSHCFWDKETSGQSSSAGGSGKTTAEMKTCSTFATSGWDFINIWHMIENVTYPNFQWQDMISPIADAGIDQTVDEDTWVIFNGGGSHGMLQITNYTWTFMDKATRTLYGVQPTYRFEDPGIFVVTLKVTNAAGNWDIDTVNVTVKDTTAPVADAGSDQDVYTGTLVDFNGSGSSDNGGIVGYSWKFDHGGFVELSGVKPTHRFEETGIFVVTLKVTDAAGNWDIDTMNVTVFEAASPLAEAGPDLVVDEGTNVTFDGSGSEGSAGIVSYIWTFHDGTANKLYGIQPTYNFDHAGVFVVTLNVTDVNANWDTDTMTVTANDITPPIAEAGPDLLVGEGDLVVLNGSGSRDNVGIVRYVWTFDCGQPEVLEGIGPAYTFNRTGNYIITLRVSDAAGNWGIDTTTVTVVAPTGPVAVAGMDRVIDEGTALQFDGSGSTASPGTIYFNWTFSDGEPVRLYGVNPVYKFNDPGTFIVTLNVTDADGNWDTDTMTVIVKDRTAPSADAGPDLIVNERTSVMFNGSSCSDNVGIVNWTWTFEYGATRIVLSGISPIFNFAVPGVYSIKLNVTDAAGFWTEDTLVITVRDITSPIADAGLDQTVPAGRNILFNGSLSTDNVAISKFFWTFTYGGKAQSLDGENVSFKFDKAGVYEVVLTVIDAAGNRGEDRVTVTVEPTVNLEYGGLLGLLWMLVVLIAVAGIAGYMIMRKRRSRKGGPIQKNGSLPRRLGRDAG